VHREVKAAVRGRVARIDNCLIIWPMPWWHGRCVQ